jgi:type IV secretion system protein VirD4
MSTTQGTMTMVDFYDLINEIEHPDAWASVASHMLAMPDAHVRRVAAEMDSKRETAPKEYGAILGSIYQNIGFLSDASVRDALSGADFSLEALCQQDCNVYIVIPAEYVSLLAPMQRAIFGSAFLHKTRHPGAPRILAIIDEAATLGHFESLLRFYSYGRGMGWRAWSIWQDFGQIARNFGREAVASFMASSQCRQFISVRDYETAEMVSKMLGTQTIEVDPLLEQSAARSRQTHIIRELMSGADPLEAGINYSLQARTAVHQTKHARAVLTPDEILNLPDDMQLLFISGLGLNPLLANKYPYYTRREMAGAYLENPYHSQTGRVPIAGRFRTRSARIITERVPKQLADWPQYQSGDWSYVEGYRPDPFITTGEF